MPIWAELKACDIAATAGAREQGSVPLIHDTSTFIAVFSCVMIVIENILIRIRKHALTGRVYVSCNHGSQAHCSANRVVQLHTCINPVVSR